MRREEKTRNREKKTTGKAKRRRGRDQATKRG
jgi:hypothetical protein